MQPTKRLIALSLLGVLLIAISSLFNFYRIVFVLYNGLLLLAVIVDYGTTKVDFEIKRNQEQKLSLFSKEAIEFEVYNKSNNDLDIAIKDTAVDFHFDVINSIAYGVIKPHEKEVLRYTIVPKKRGFYQFKDVYVKYLSKYKLVYIHKVYEIPAIVKVYPNIKDVRKYRLMVFEGYINTGGKRVNRRGEGLEYESLREYIVGDSYKKINWKATASMNKPIINQYDVEKNQDVIALIDSGKSMSYEVRGYKKLDLAINTALILADIANVSGDKSGLMVFNKEVQQYVKPGTGAVHRNKLLESLYTIDYNRNVSNFYEAFKYLNTMHKKRSVLFVFTEFETLDESTEYLKVLPQIAKRHLVIMFMMKKEKVIELTKGSSSDNKELFVKGAAFDVLNDRREIIRKLRQNRVMCVECLPETLTTHVINYYIRLKSKGVS